MSIVKHFLCLLIVLAPLAHAEEDVEPGNEAPVAAESTSAPAKKKSVRRAMYQEYTLGFSMWQEEIKATRGTESSPMRTQALGVNFGWNWNRFFGGSNWRQWHTLDFTIGQLKGKGSSSGIPDELKKQSFYMVQGAPGLMWRNSPVSEIGFALPIAYRFIKWDVISSSGLIMDKKTSYSVGVSLTYVARFSGRNSMHVTLASQHMWNAPMWSVGFNRVF